MPMEESTLFLKSWWENMQCHVIVSTLLFPQWKFFFFTIITLFSLHHHLLYTGCIGMHVSSWVTGLQTMKEHILEVIKQNPEILKTCFQLNTFVFLHSYSRNPLFNSHISLGCAHSTYPAFTLPRSMLLTSTSLLPTTAFSRGSIPSFRTDPPDSPSQIFFLPLI